MTTSEQADFEILPLIERKHERKPFDLSAAGHNFSNVLRLEHGAQFIELMLDYKSKASTLLGNIWSMKPNEKDKMDLSKFASVIEGICFGKNTRKISTELSVPYNTILRWRAGKAPNIVKTLKSVIDSERPKSGQKWLPLSLGTHGELKDPIIRAVEKVGSIQDVRDVLVQLKPLETTYERALRFGLNGDDIASMRTYLFFYLLGVMVGDASKNKRSHRKISTMEIDLTLSKKHDSNIRFGEFVAMCVNSLGLRMNRAKDRPPTKQIFNGAYRWMSQSSPLVSWIFEACLGLHEGQKTTYDSIKADWILAADDNEKVGFVQGLADSDGFNDIQSLEAHIISSPNAPFMEAVLKSLGIKCRREYSARFGTENVIMRMKEAHDLPIYNPWVMSYRFIELDVLMKAKRYTYAAEWPSWLKDEITRLVKSKKKVRNIFNTLLNRYGVLIPCDTIRYFAKTYEKRSLNEKGEDTFRCM